jgi:hypothetical protein
LFTFGALAVIFLVEIRTGRQTLVIIIVFISTTSQTARFITGQTSGIAFDTNLILDIISNRTLTDTLRRKQVEIRFTRFTDILIVTYFAVGNARQTLVILE